MGEGWKVDITGATAVIDKAADAGSTTQQAAIAVDASLRAVVHALAGCDAEGAAAAFADARRGEATSTVQAMSRAISAATNAMDAFALADESMAQDTVARQSEPPQVAR